MFARGDTVNVISWPVLRSVAALIVLRSVTPGDAPGPGVDGSRGAARGARETRVRGRVPSDLLALDTGGVGWLTRGVAGGGIARAVERLGGGVAGTGACRGGGVARGTGGVSRKLLKENYSHLLIVRLCLILVLVLTKWAVMPR